MKKSAFISDILFTFFLVGIFTLCLFRYLRLPLSLSSLLSGLCGVLAAVAVGMTLFLRQKNMLSKKSDELQKQKLLLHLALLPDKEKTELFCQALHGRAFGKLRFLSQDKAYLLRFTLAPLSADAVAEASRVKTALPKTILCAESQDDAVRLCARLGIELKTGEYSYALLKNANALPTQYLGDEQPEKKLKKRLRFCFARSNAKRFFTGGTLILLSSLISPFPLYYLIFGGVLLVVAVVIRIFGYA